jgi:cytochrome b561
MSITRSAIDTKPYTRAGQADRTKVLLRCLHLAIGLLSLLVFLAAGLYLYLYLELPERVQTDQVRNVMYRANHIYLLCAALLNVQLGCYLSVLNFPLARTLQWLGSILLLLAPLLLLLAILEEPVVLGSELSYTLPVIALFLGVVLHAAARVLARRQSR